MCRGGGGNKIRLCTKGKKKYNLHFTVFSKVTSENILSLPHVFFFLAFLIPTMHRTREQVASQGSSGSTLGTDLVWPRGSKGGAGSAPWGTVEFPDSLSRSPT